MYTGLDWCRNKQAGTNNWGNLRGFASVSNEQIDRSTFEIVSAGLHSVWTRPRTRHDERA